MVLYLGSLGASYAPRNIPVFPLPACGCAGAAASGAETSARRSARWKGRMPIVFAPPPRLAILDLGPTRPHCALSTADWTLNQFLRRDTDADNRRHGSTRQRMGRGGCGHPAAARGGAHGGSPPPPRNRPARPRAAT